MSTNGEGHITPNILFVNTLETISDSPLVDIITNPLIGSHPFLINTGESTLAKYKGTTEYCPIHSQTFFALSELRDNHVFSSWERVPFALCIGHFKTLVLWTTHNGVFPNLTSRATCKKNSSGEKERLQDITHMHVHSHTCTLWAHTQEQALIITE